MISKKQIYLGGLIILVIVLALILLGKTEKSPSTGMPAGLREIKIGYLPVGASHVGLPILVAKEKGFFQEEGLKVELIEMEPGMSVSALLGGSIDYSPFGVAEIGASLKDASISTFMLTAQGPPSFMLIGRPGLEIDEIKTIGITYWHIPMHYQALRLVEEEDLEAEIVVSGAPAATVAMLIKGDVDAVLASDLRAIQIQTKGFQFIKEIDVIHPTSLSARKEKIESDPEEVQSVVRAFQKSIDYILQADIGEVAEFLLKHSSMEATAENIDLAEAASSFIVKALDRRGLDSDEGAEVLIKYAKAGNYQTLQDVENQIVTEDEIKQVFDFRFVK
jgi:NitT/TauT family transport system substrate-binding protein